MKDSDEFSILKKVFKNLGNQYFDSSNLLIGYREMMQAYLKQEKI